MGCTQAIQNNKKHTNFKETSETQDIDACIDVGICHTCFLNIIKNKQQKQQIELQPQELCYICNKYENHNSMSTQLKLDNISNEEEDFEKRQNSQTFCNFDYNKVSHDESKSIKLSSNPQDSCQFNKQIIQIIQDTKEKGLYDEMMDKEKCDISEDEDDLKLFWVKYSQQNIQKIQTLCSNSKVVNFSFMFDWIRIEVHNENDIPSIIQESGILKSQINFNYNPECLFKKK